MVRALLLLALVASASAFTAPAMGGLKLRSSSTAMTMKAEGPMAAVPAKLAKAAAIAAATLPSAVFAEGTGEVLGIDDTRLIVPILLIPVICFILFAGFSAEQDNTDFFDTYDQRRK
mmetsp:Transcript_39047/g.76324  ORF Transcript_39047/g.76324 Transcript_39047/m.76324 type:complete len:117 (+) Transcript_39047:45-395(+)|eukprot:CAMPEP_0173381482 /NCGR_PEP_ID=MMETSP1356-20130122/3850_1 /TAXON_ID=77927 ORGANISM="Hemiselmis virescens, Strain PCC157" /NCGR_SAMPLE_ID=MMETSP1356 /ASSEMBLY_ACC=CAM_ASM_000847 /LENGTH=116 /DNA_ID=CAMNT_0014335315 /DNA_START=30 /DNA_END=380 /DNA_ORIENTATION=-